MLQHSRETSVLVPAVGLQSFVLLVACSWPLPTLLPPYGHRPADSLTRAACRLATLSGYNVDGDFTQTRCASMATRRLLPLADCFIPPSRRCSWDCEPCEESRMSNDQRI